MDKTFYQYVIFLAGSFVCLYLAFSPAVNIPYASHDSIRYFHKFYNKEREASEYPQYRYEYDLGRPFTAELEGFLYRKVNHLSDMSQLRLITIFVFALSAAMLTMMALSAGMEIIPAFCLSVIIFTLPGIQDFIFVPYLTNALAVFLSLLAYFIWSQKLRYGMRFIFAFALLEMSFCLYPPSTFIFLVPTALMLIFHHNGQVVKRTWVKDVLLWISVAGANYFILRGFYYTQMKASGHEIAFTLKQVLLNIMTFLPQSVPQTFNLWNVYYSEALGLSMIILVALFLIIDSFTSKKIGWKRLSAIIAVFLIVNLVWFFFGGYQPREFIASQALVLALLYWCGERLGDILKIKKELLNRTWPVLAVCAALIIANHMITSNVLNNHSELMFIRSRIAQFVNSSTKEIHVIRLKDSLKGYNNLPRVYDNLNSVTPDYEIPDLLRVALKDMGDPFELHCIVTYSDFGEPFRVLPNAVVIDMNDLVYILSPEHKKEFLW